MLDLRPQSLFLRPRLSIRETPTTNQPGISSLKLAIRGPMEIWRGTALGGFDRYVFVYSQTIILFYVKAVHNPILIII